jgi:hypothetical protein
VDEIRGDEVMRWTAIVQSRRLTSDFDFSSAQPRLIDSSTHPRPRPPTVDAHLGAVRNSSKSELNAY